MYKDLFSGLNLFFFRNGNRLFSIFIIGPVDVRSVCSILCTRLLIIKASKRQPGASGRLHRTLTGGWVWSEEEDEAGEAPESDDESSQGEDKRPMNQLQRAESSGSENEEVKYMELC